MEKLSSGFLGIDSAKPERVLIIPAGYEISTTYGKGTGAAPQAIIEASKNIELFDTELKCQPYEIGIKTYPQMLFDIQPENMIENIYSIYKKAIGKYEFIICIGGEHTVTFAPVKALKEKYNNLTVISFDAHADLRDLYQNSRFSHACVMRRLFEMGINISVIGVKSMSFEEHEFYKKNKKRIKIFFNNEYKEVDIDNFIADLNRTPVYLSIDVDCMDSALMPATGTPEPSGFSYDSLLYYIKKFYSKLNIIGCDVVEFMPIPFLKAYDFTIARLVYKLIGYKFYLSQNL